MAIALADSYRVSPRAVFRDLEGEAVILHLDSGTYFGLNRVGTRIWQLVEQHGRLAAVFDILAREYAVDPAVLERDLLSLVADLERHGLASRIDESGG